MSKKPMKKQSSLLSFIKGGENRHLNAVTVDLTGDEDTQQAVAAPVLCQEIIEVDSDSEDDVPLACKRAKVGVVEQGMFKSCFVRSPSH